MEHLAGASIWHALQFPWSDRKEIAATCWRLPLLVRLFLGGYSSRLVVVTKQTLDTSLGAITDGSKLVAIGGVWVRFRQGSKVSLL